MKKIILIIILIAGFIYPPNVFAAKKIKVLVLGFNSYTNDQNYSYIEPSITDAVRKYLKEKFIFKEVDIKKVLEYAKLNFYYPTEFFTKGTSMHLGLETGADIVVSGGFEIIKKRRRATRIITLTRIYDISKRKITKEFKVKGYADGRMFDTVEKIAQKVGKEMKSILPNEKEWKQQLLESPDEDNGNSSMNNQITFLGGIRPMGMPTSSLETIATDQVLKESDISNSLSFAIEYKRERFYFRNTFLWGAILLNMGANTFDTEVKTVSSDVSLLSYGLMFGAGYQYPLRHKFFVNAGLGAGYIHGSINLKSTINSSTIIESNLPFTGIQSTIFIGGGYQLTRRISFDLRLSYNNVFYANDLSASISTTGGISANF